MIEYGDYFYPEIKKFKQTASNDQKKKELPDDFEEKRRVGENNLNICEIILNDYVEEFIINYKNNLFSANNGNQTIKRNPTLIEYIQCFLDRF